MIFHVHAYVCIQQQMDLQKYPSLYPVGCTTMCYIVDDRDTSVFPDVEVYVCNSAVRNEGARTRVKQDGNGVFFALPWIPAIWKND